jgi:hypothetical protein
MPIRVRQDTKRVGDIPATMQRLGSAIVVAIGGAFAKWFATSKLSEEDDKIRAEAAELRVRVAELAAELAVLRRMLDKEDQ